MGPWPALNSCPSASGGPQGQARRWVPHPTAPAPGPVSAPATTLILQAREAWGPPPATWQQAQRLRSVFSLKPGPFIVK